MTNPVDELSRLLKECNARVTFDPERSLSKPCYICGTTDAPRDLVKLGEFTIAIGGHRPGDAITRPMCPACVQLVEKRTEASHLEVAAERRVHHDPGDEHV